MWTPALHVRHKFPVRAASHRHPLPHVDGSPALRVLRGDPTPHASSALLRVVGNAYLSPGMQGVSQVLHASLSACQALRTPTDPPASHPRDAFVVASGALKPSPSALLPLRGCTRLQGVRSPFRPTECPVYASHASFGVRHLLHICNTRYEWLVRPYSMGTFTPQEAPSFAWRTNAAASAAAAPPSRFALAQNRSRAAVRLEALVRHLHSA